MWPYPTLAYISVKGVVDPSVLINPTPAWQLVTRPAVAMAESESSSTAAEALVPSFKLDRVLNQGSPPRVHLLNPTYEPSQIKLDAASPSLAALPPPPLS